MFEKQLAALISQSRMIAQRSEGVAFFRLARDLYRLEEVSYLCVNLPLPVQPKCYTHCFYSDSGVKQFATTNLITPDFLGHLDDADFANSPSNELVVQLSHRVGETAVFGIIALRTADWEEQRPIVTRECKILSGYFHGHVLRINGCAAETNLLLSARELDCLKWTAAGKTAWEASVILGITERTVRFHLDAARDKLRCTTTTQAVAKAVANHLIDL